MNSSLYQILLIVLLIAGLVPALIFLGHHRPRQWRRAAAWDASGLVIVVTLWYLRGIVLIVLRWPGAPPRDWADVIVSLVLLAIIDALLILRLVSYRSFVSSEHPEPPQLPEEEN